MTYLTLKKLKTIPSKQIIALTFTVELDQMKIFLLNIYYCQRQRV